MHLPRRSIPQISGLIAFEATARHLSFSRAAEELSLSQGAVTKRVRKLENQLNVVLMSRGGHQAQLTRFGRIFLPQVQSILAQIDRTTRDLLAEASQHRTVTVKADAALTLGWLLPVLEEFRWHCPEIEINLQTAETETPSLVEADIHIREAQPDTAHTGETLLFHSSLVAVVSKQAAAGRSDAELLRTGPLLRLSSQTDAWDDWLDSAANPPFGTCHDHCATLLAAVENGAGLAVLPRLLVLDDRRQARLRQIGPERPTMMSYMMTLSPGAANTRGTQDLADWITRAARRTAVLRTVGGMDEAAGAHRRFPA